MKMKTIFNVFHSPTLKSVAKRLNDGHTANSNALSSREMNRLFIFILLLFGKVSTAVGVAYADASSESTSHASIADGMHHQVMNDIMNHQVSNKSIRTSPECWAASIATINRWDTAVGKTEEYDGYQKQVHHTSGSSYCAAMTSEQQEVLALELTNCQLMKEKRQIYDTNREMDAVELLGCTVGDGSAVPYHASACLPIMSEYALNLYHVILLHTNDVCTRLTEKSMMLQKEEVTQMLVYASSAVSNQMQNILENAATAVEKMQVQSVMLDAHSTMISHSLTMIEKQSALIEEQSSKMRDQQLESDRLQKEREEASALALERMTNKTTSFLQEYAEKMKSKQSELEYALHNQIKEQKEDLERMQEMITSANTQMQPLSSIETYVKMATSGFTLLKSFLNFFLWMNIAWMVTTLPLISSAKCYLYGVFTLGLLAEIAVVWFGEKVSFMNKGVMDGVDAIELIRFWTRVVAVTAILLSSLVSCFCPVKKSRTSSITMDELLKSQMEFVSKMNESAQVEKRSGRNRADKHAKSTSVDKFSEQRRGRSKERMVLENTGMIISNRKFKPKRRRSRSPRCSSLTELTMPVVTPIKPRAPTNNVAVSQSQARDDSGTYYVHRSNIIAKQEEEANRLELECLRALYRNSATSIASSGSDQSCASSVTSIESSSSSTVKKKNKRKRTVTEIYASGDEESQFFSANDEEMSVSSDTSCASYKARGKKNKKCKLAGVPEEIQID